VASVPWVVLDSKHMFILGETPIVSAFNPRLPHQIVRVPIDEYEQASWMATIDAAMRAGGPRIIYIDEVADITPPRRAPPPLSRAIRTGRQLGIGVWCGTQRPKDIPSVVFTEAEHFFVFELGWEDDRKKVTTFTSDRLGRLLNRVRRHDYVYFSRKARRMLYVTAKGVIK
jgi:DNA helicase HerA-like ATPase